MRDPLVCARASLFARMKCHNTILRWSQRQLNLSVAAAFVLLGTPSFAADEVTQKELRELRDENRVLRQQMTRQQQVIESLTTKVAGIEEAQKERDEIQAGERGLIAPPQKPTGPSKVSISGQLAAAYLKTGSEGMFPKGEFRVDEARVFLEAQAWEDIYGFVELNIMTREAWDDSLRLGEAYVDIERVLKWRGLDSLINLRLGRFYIPFGEEYSVRYPMDNPLVSHSLMDFWGVDEGIELYGSHGPIQYAVAVQNGGHPAVGDFTSDKSIAARVAYEPKKWLRVSGSAMRTGDLDPNGDGVSEMWFGNGFFRSLGNGLTTTEFHADLAEGDVQFLFSRGHLKLAGGGIRYDDNDRAADNQRDVWFYSAEGVFRFTKRFYGAARFSQIFADDGFPIVAHGTWPQYFDTELTDNIWRLSLGLGYTPNPHFVFKLEYTLERGTTVSGRQREHEDLFAAQAALRF
jgi:hypothetical protein